MNKRLMLLLRVGFILTGIVTVLLGQILPVLARKISLTDTESGTLFIFQFTGSLAGTFSYSKLSAKLGYAKVIVLSYGLMIVGLLLLGLDSWPAYAAAISIYGLGIGLNIPTTNMFVVELGHARSASGLSIVNFFWGFGAILCKPFVDLTGTTQSISIPVAILAALLFIMALLFGFSGYKKDKISDIDEPATSSFPIWTTSFAWMIAGFNFIHIGIESSVGGWITTYQDRLAGNSSAGILSAAAVFFVTLVAGRMLGPVFFRYAAENTVLFVSLIVMAIGTIVVLYAGSLGSLLLGAAVLGSGCSVVFPTNMARFTRTFGPRATRRAMPIFVLGSLGGASFTWLVGYVSSSSGDLRSGFYVILACCVSLLILHTAITVSQAGRYRRSNPPASDHS